MKKFAKVTLFLGWILIFVNSCNDKEGKNPYSQILDNPPFAILTDSIAHYPEDDGLYFRRAILLNQNNFSEPALADFNKAWSLKKEEKYAYGVSTILNDSKSGEAVTFLKEAIKKLPGSFLLQLNLARSYDNMKETDKALEICNQLLEKNPQQVDVLKLKATLLAKEKKEPEAIQTLEKAYQITPFDIELNYMLALQYAESKNGKLISLTDSLLRMDTAGQHAEPYYYKGIYYSTMNEKEKAIAQFDEAIKHNYNFLEAYIEKGSIFFEQKKYDDALKVFNLVLTISPEFADSYYWIAKCQQAIGKKDEAKLNYQRAVGLDASFKAAKDSADKIK